MWGVLPLDVLHEIVALLSLESLSNFAATDKLAKSVAAASAKERAGTVVAGLAGLETFDSVSFKRNLRLVHVGARKEVVKKRVKHTILCRDVIIGVAQALQSSNVAQLHKSYHFKVVRLIKKLERMDRELYQVAEGKAAFEDIQAVSDASDSDSSKSS